MNATASRNGRSPQRTPEAEAKSAAAAALNAEATVLGFGLRTGNIDEAAVLDESDFLDAGHRLVFRAIIELRKNGAPIDAASVGGWLSERGLISTDTQDVLADITFLGLAKLIDGPFTGSIAHHVKLVQEAASRRRMADVLGKFTADLGRSTGTAADLIERLQERLHTAVNGSAKSDLAGLATTALTTLRPCPIRWLVPNYLPLGKLILLAGDGGHGKSTLTLSMAADLSRGLACLGLTYEALPPADTLLVSCEDDYSDTVVPRLLSAGADLSKIFKVDGVKVKGGKVAPFSLAQYEAMENELKARPAVRLVVIDPAGAFIGRTGVDDYNDSELRSLLGPMAELAARREVTIILVKHLVKGATTKAVHKVGGSAGYVNGVRAAFIIAPDGEEPEKKLFMPIKFNLGPRPSGLAYRMQSLDEKERSQVIAAYGQHLEVPDQERLAEQLFRIEWLGAVDADADQVLGDQARRGPNKVEKAVEWLAQFLAVNAYPSDEILDAAKKAGFTFDNIKEAKSRLKEKGLSNSNRNRLQGTWWSGFGHPDQWVLREAPPVAPQSPESPASPQSPLTESSQTSSFTMVTLTEDQSSQGREGRGGSVVPEENKAPQTAPNRRSKRGAV